MSASMLRRLSLGVLVFALAFPSHAVAAPWQLGDLLGQVRGFIASLWAENGCELTPDGRCGAVPRPVIGEQGCMLEPDGRCGAAPRPIFGEIGCELMPDGRCKAAPRPVFGEIGCEIQPDGRCRG